MAKIFLDANIFIDLIKERKIVDGNSLSGNKLYISPLSIHILLYIFREKIPTLLTSKIIGEFEVVDFDESICIKSSIGPTSDFEDNVHLHSAAEADCDFFITNDKKILGMKFFGKTRIVSSLDNI